MKITATASGGFAGLCEHFELDTGCHRDGPAIEALLGRLDAAGAPECPVGADMVRWEITLDDGRQCRTVRIAEDGPAFDAGWQALIAHLRGQR